MFNAEDRARYARLLAFIRPHWKVVLLAIVGTVLYGLTEPLVPFVLQPLVDGGFAEGSMRTVYILTALLFFGFALRGLASYTATCSMNWLAQQVVYTLRGLMFRQLLRLPMGYFDAHSAGSIVSRFTYDVLQLMAASTDAVAILLREVVTIIALTVFLLYLDWKMTLLLFVVAPVLAFVIIHVSRKLRRMARAMQEDMSGMNHVVDEALRGRAIVRIYNGQDFEFARFDRQAEAVRFHAVRSTQIAAGASPVVEMTIIAALSAVIILFALKARATPDQMTTGVFVSFLGTMALLFPPIKRLGKVNEPIQRGLAAAQSIFDFLDTPAEPQPALPPCTITRGEIVFRDVSFSYPEQPVLSGFNLHIQAGETVALIGESGSGKSTIAALLAGFYAPEAGAILIDGTNTAEMSLADRRRAIAFVSQDTVLFSTTIAANIAYADPEPDAARIEMAAASANAADFITKLPHGYTENIGPQGGRLSGGQKQRIAIARALYKDAPILILDEATSALDNHSEAKVQEAVERLRKGRTAIIIAHRLSTIRNADRIVVLEQGRIVESGSHAELLGRGGSYAKLLSQHYQ